MHSRADFPALPTFSKNFVTDATTKGAVVRLNSSGIALSASGYGASTATSTAFVVPCAGTADMRVVSVCRYVAPTAAGSENFGLMLRLRSLENAGDTDYYIARCNTGNARISKVVAGTFTNLASSAFALAQNTEVTITFEVIGNALSATFDAGGAPATVNLSATDSSITAAGFAGFRTISQTGICKTISVELL